VNEHGQVHQEFVVSATHARTKRVLTPFIVLAIDETAARKLCQRTYLVVQSVERYVEVAGKEKPRSLPYGPPISDKDFDRDYGNRPADTSGERIPLNLRYPATCFFGLMGLAMAGPYGSLLGFSLGFIIDILLKWSGIVCSDSPRKGD
jgi:hypothetical protein